MLLLCQNAARVHVLCSLSRILRRAPRVPCCACCAHPTESTGKPISPSVMRAGFHQAQYHLVLMRCRVAVIEGQSARLIQVTDIVTYDDELSPLQVRDLRRAYAVSRTLFFYYWLFCSLWSTDFLPMMNGTVCFDVHLLFYFFCR
jgi:hypothetical protein